MDSGENHENPPPCARGCGFFGSPAMRGLCSWCYREVCRIEQLEKMRPPLAAAESQSGSPKVAAAPSSSYQGEEPPKAADRCGRCKKKVRLCARFECRCGSTFCAAHRLPETHECAFDYKAHGRAAIAKANPVVVKDKLQRIWQKLDCLIFLQKIHQQSLLDLSHSLPMAKGVALILFAIQQSHQSPEAESSFSHPNPAAFAPSQNLA